MYLSLNHWSICLLIRQAYVLPPSPPKLPVWSRSTWTAGTEKRGGFLKRWQQRVWIRTLRNTACFSHKIIGPTYCVLFPFLARRFKSRQWKFPFLHVVDSYSVYLPCIYSPILWVWLHFSSDTDPPLLSVTFRVIHFLILCIPKWKPKSYMQDLHFPFQQRQTH